MPKGNIGLYRDDDLAAFRKMGAKSQLDKARKDFSKMFNDLELKITAQSNLKIVNNLDITLNLAAGKFYPFYRKPNNTPILSMPNQITRLL